MPQLRSPNLKEGGEHAPFLKTGTSAGEVKTIVEELAVLVAKVNQTVKGVKTFAEEAIFLGTVKVAKIVGEALTMTKVLIIEGEKENETTGSRLVKFNRVSAQVVQSLAYLTRGAATESLEEAASPYNDFTPGVPRGFYNIGAGGPANITITGWIPPNPPLAGRNGIELTIFNGLEGVLTLEREGAGSAEINRFNMPKTLELASNAAATFIYFNLRWNLTGHT